MFEIRIISEPHDAPRIADALRSTFRATGIRQYPTRDRQHVRLYAQVPDVAPLSLTFWRDRYRQAANIRWDDSLPPGGEVCATCGEPVESESCPDHDPTQRLERLRQRLAAAEADLLAVRGTLSPNGFPRRVPPEIEIHESVTPAVEWLLAEVDRLRAERCECGDSDEGPCPRPHPRRLITPGAAASDQGQPAAPARTADERNRMDGIENEDFACGEGHCICYCVSVQHACGCDCPRCPYCQQRPEHCDCED